MGNVIKVACKWFLNGLRTKCVENASQFNEDFIKSHNKVSDERYFFEVDVQYPKKLHDFHNDITFLLKRMKTEKVEKSVDNLQEKKENVIHISNLKRALSHGLILRKVHRATTFTQKASLKSYIDVNTELRKETKNYIEKDFFKPMNNAVFGKTMENLRSHRDMKLIRNEARRNYLVSGPNYHTTIFFQEIY